MSTTLERVTLLELQAALRAGAGPAEALASAASGPLEDAGRAARLGHPLAQIAADVATGDPAADFLLRCLALTERSGGGGADAVDAALEALRDEADLQRLLRVRTAQARGTAVILAAVPVAAWTLLVVLDGRMLAFYATPLGLLSGGLAVGLAVAAWRWMRRLAAATAAAARSADPLTAKDAPPDWRRGLALALIVALPIVGWLGVVPALLAAAAAGCGAARRRTPSTTAAGGAAETVAMITVALEAGMAPATAFAEVASLAPAAAVPALTSAARRMAGGWRCEDALADTPLAALGATVGAAERWGAPAGPALRALAADLRADRRAAVEVAAERLQLALIFPTTLLTLPAFVLGVVPPLLWTTVRG